MLFGHVKTSLLTANVHIELIITRKFPDRQSVCQNDKLNRPSGAFLVLVQQKKVPSIYLISSTSSSRKSITACAPLIAHEKPTSRWKTNKLVQLIPLSIVKILNFSIIHCRENYLKKSHAPVAFTRQIALAFNYPRLQLHKCTLIAKAKCSHVVKVGGYWKCTHTCDWIIRHRWVSLSLIHYAKSHLKAASAFGKEGHGINVSTSAGHLRRGADETRLSQYIMYLAHSLHSKMRPAPRRGGQPTFCSLGILFPPQPHSLWSLIVANLEWNCEGEAIGLRLLVETPFSSENLLARKELR